MNIENLKRARENAGLTQTQAAQKIGVSDGTYKNYEQGKREPNGDKIVTIANAFGVTTDYLLGRPTAQPPTDVFGGAVCDAHGSFFSGDPAPHTGQLYGEIVPAVAEDGTGF